MKPACQHRWWSSSRDISQDMAKATGRWQGQGHHRHFTTACPGQGSISDFSAVYFHQDEGLQGGEFWQGNVLDQRSAPL